MARRQGPAAADDPTVIAEWRDRVARYRASGTLAAEFAAKEGVKVRQITWWIGELRRIDQGRPRSRRGARARTPDFVRLQVSSATSSLPSPSIEVVLRNGRSLRVTGEFNETVLRRLVSTLEGA
jgi:hypothetical protein